MNLDGNVVTIFPLLINKNSINRLMINFRGHCKFKSKIIKFRFQTYNLLAIFQIIFSLKLPLFPIKNPHSDSINLNMI